MNPTPQQVQTVIDNMELANKNVCPNCGSKETKETDIYKCNDADICEYTLRCKGCDTILGHWAYGNWQY